MTRKISTAARVESLKGKSEKFWIEAKIKIRHPATNIPDWTGFSVTRFGEIPPLRQNFKNLRQFLRFSLGSVGQNFEPTFANLFNYLANFHCSKWPNIEQIIKPSSHTDWLDCSHHNDDENKRSPKLWTTTCSKLSQTFELTWCRSWCLYITRIRCFQRLCFVFVFYVVPIVCLSFFPKMGQPRPLS